MGKFFGLVANEYIKILKKLSTIIMILLIILAAVGFAGLISYANSYNSVEYMGDEILEYSGEIEWLESTTPEGWEDDVRLYRLINDNEVHFNSEAYYFVNELLYSANFGDLTSAEKLPVLEEYFENGWRSACELLKPYCQSSAAEWSIDYRLAHDIGFADEWKSELINLTAEARTSAEFAEGEEKQQFEDNIALYLYRLENDIEVNANTDDPSNDYLGNSYSFWTLLIVDASSLVTFVWLLIIIIAGSSISNEYSRGTIKLLLINPVKRGKILMAKYFTVLSFGLIMIAIFFITTMISGMLFMGISDVGAPYLTVENGVVSEGSALLKAISVYLLRNVPVVVMATFALAISTLTRSSALSIGLSVFLMLSGSALAAVLHEMGIDFVKYTIFANVALASIIDGNSMIPMHSLGFAICIIAIHMVVFLLTMWDGFTKKEV